MAAESGDNRSPTATRQPFASQEEEYVGQYSASQEEECVGQYSASQEEECVGQYSASQEECLRCKCGQHVPHMISHYVVMTTTCGMFHVVAEL